MTRPRRTQLPRVEGEQEVRKALKAMLKVEGTRGLARRLKLSPAAISLIATGKERVSPRIAEALGFEKVILFRFSPPTRRPQE